MLLIHTQTEPNTRTDMACSAGYGCSRMERDREMTFNKTEHESGESKVRGLCLARKEKNVLLSRQHVAVVSGWWLVKVGSSSKRQVATFKRFITLIKLKPDRLW